MGTLFRRRHIYCSGIAFGGIYGSDLEGELEDKLDELVKKQQYVKSYYNRCKQAEVKLWIKAEWMNEHCRMPEWILPNKMNAEWMTLEPVSLKKIAFDKQKWMVSLVYLLLKYWKKKTSQIKLLRFFLGNSKSCAGGRNFFVVQRNFIQRCKRFATASTCTQVAVFFVAEMGTANSLHDSAEYSLYFDRFGVVFSYYRNKYRVSIPFLGLLHLLFPVQVIGLYFSRKLNTVWRNRIVIKLLII